MSTGPKRIFDKHTQTMHRARAWRMASDRFLWREAAEGLSARLEPLARRYARALAIEPQAAKSVRAVVDGWTITPFDEDERLAIEPGGFDLVASMMSLHGMNDLPGALAQMRASLVPGGTMVAALFGGETLRELRAAFAAGEAEASGGAAIRVAPFADVRVLGDLMTRLGYAMAVADIERTVVHYRDFATLARDLKAMGETNAMAGRRILSRSALAAALRHYATSHAAQDGKLRATFDIIYLIGFNPR